jgi:hypothetical protein
MDSDELFDYIIITQHTEILNLLTLSVQPKV